MVAELKDAKSRLGCVSNKLGRFSAALEATREAIEEEARWERIQDGGLMVHSEYSVDSHILPTAKDIAEALDERQALKTRIQELTERLDIKV